MPLATTPPVGTVSMLFTDIEGSTRLAQELGADWPEVLTEHRRIVRDAIADAGGYVEGTEGDSFFATFASAGAALDAAINAQRGLRSFAWPEAVGELRVRMGLHTGFAEHIDGHYVGIEVHRGARVAAAASGGQVLLTEASRGPLQEGPRAEDLGWHRLKDFPDPIRLFHLVVDEDRPADAFPPPKTLDVRPTNLPPEDRPIVGRDAELHAILTAFLKDEARLVTLTGLGGVGKTTLALAAARSLLDAYSGGVWLVRAEALRSRQELLAAIAAAMHVRDVAGTDLLREIAVRLETGRYLLVLDNLEHLTDAGVLVSEILKCAPGGSILATSRTVLRLESERTIAIGSMEPEQAVEMFMNRAVAADPSLSLADPATREAVMELCERLGRLPLAMELAAARLRLMSPHELLQRLGSALDIKSSEADRPERQRSVRATIEWTLGLLPEDAATLFTRLGVFAGPPPLDVIETVCGTGIDVLEAAATLVDFSLLRRAPTGLELVEALREVAAERFAASAETDEIRRAHAAAMVVLGRSVRAPSTADRKALDVMDKLRFDTWNAAEWARANDRKLHCALVANLSSWWAWTGGLRATMGEIETALEHDDLRPPERGELLLCKAHILLLSGRPSEAIPIAEQALEMVPGRSDTDRGDDLIVLALAQQMAGEAERSITTSKAALESYRRSGDRARIVTGLILVAQAAMQAGDTESAGPLLDEAEASGLSQDKLSSIGLANIRADWSLMTGDAARALAGFTRSLEDGMAGSQFASYDIAGIAVALEKLGEAELALEVGTALAETATAWGSTLETFSYFEGGVPAAIERARRALPAERATAAEARGRATEPSERAAHALGIAHRVLDRLGVSTS